MPNILAQLPPELKETVKVIREEYDREERENVVVDVAADLECHIVPEENQIQLIADNNLARDARLFKAHLGGYNADIKEGDILLRGDDPDDPDDELRVFLVRQFGTRLTQLVLQGRGIV